MRFFLIAVLSLAALFGNLLASAAQVHMFSAVRTGDKHSGDTPSFQESLTILYRQALTASGLCWFS